MTAIVRHWRPEDVGGLLRLMRDLAVFEGYIDEFAVTESALLERGFGDRPEFSASVAEEGGELVGMAVAYDVPFTWTLTPTLYLKELYVAPGSRSRGLGRRLVAALAQNAVCRGCTTMRWSVLAGNVRAAEFYRSMAGRHDAKWEPWILEQPGLEALARDADQAWAAPRPGRPPPQPEHADR